MIENPVIEQQTDKTWLRQKDIAKKKGLPKATMYDMIRDGKFPKPLKMGRMSFWDESEVDQAMKANLQPQAG